MTYGLSSIFLFRFQSSRKISISATEPALLNLCHRITTIHNKTMIITIKENSILESDVCLKAYGHEMYYSRNNVVTEEEKIESSKSHRIMLGVRLYFRLVSQIKNVKKEHTFVVFFSCLLTFRTNFLAA